MAISPPTDIILDVANAADPAQVRMATARLAKLAADPTAGGTFGTALAAAAKEAANTGTRPSSPGTSTLSQARLANPASRPGSGPANAKEAYQKFESLLLQNFVESMLPKDDELYGDKASAGVYRSMLAEQFATQLSKAGGIGIAKSIAAKHPPRPTPIAQLPGVKPNIV